MKKFPLGFGVALAFASAAFAASSSGFQFQNPVRAGDYPDPSVIRVGNDYWATATSSEWAPHFPILHSRDLVNWEVKGHVFETMPGWAKANFWAPEIAEDKGKYFIYYTAREISSNRLAVAVATANHPAGPWTDHGPLISQDAGSIDGVPFTDAKGQRWLIWKEDGNSKKQPTPLWISRLSPDGLKLVGEIREILRNEPGGWEGAVVEGPFVLRRGDTYYLFYAGNACCGRGCNYAVGVARAKDMLGPWEKAPTNPIMTANATWKCPGHGSLVTDPDGRTWFLYHAYAQKGFVATGREMLLDEVVFGADGWPTINNGKGPSTKAAAPKVAKAQRDITALRDDFNARRELGPGWQWLIGRKPSTQIADGVLTVSTTDALGASAVQSITVPSFIAETAVDVRKLAPGALAGLAVYGDRANHLTLLTDGKKIQIWSEQKSQRTKVAEADAQPGAAVRLRVASINGNRFRFAIQGAGGKWTELGAETDGSFLPPWDRGVRTGVYVVGAAGAKASFDYFAATPGDEKLFAP